MRKTTLLRIAIAASSLLVSTAHAQLFRAYLAADGSDGNPCTLQAPCRLLPAALNAVASGGEIWMLDSANYNTATVNINKSVSILAVPGVVGSIVALNGGSAVTITADDLDVALRNVVIGPVAGAAPGAFGAWMTGASKLTIEDSLISNLPFDGVRVQGGGTLHVTNSMLRNNGFHAILLENGPSASISRTQMVGNALGGVYVRTLAGFTSMAVVSDSVISGGEDGVHAKAGIVGATSRISLARSTIDRTSYALRSTTNGAGSAEINIGSSLVIESTNAWYQDGTGSTILSLGNNQMSGNGGSLGVLTPLAPQ